MKKKKLFKSPAIENLLKTKKEKDILSIINDPKKMQAVLELGKAASKLQENISNTNSLEEWAAKVIKLLPHNFENKGEFALAFMEFVNEYRNKSERNDSTDCG